jgi:hypothetical protein
MFFSLILYGFSRECILQYRPSPEIRRLRNKKLLAFCRNSNQSKDDIPKQRTNKNSENVLKLVLSKPVV